MKNLWKWLRTRKFGWPFGYPWLEKQEFFKIIFSALFLVAAGASINYFFQTSSWKREARFELLKIELNEGKEIVKNLSYLIDRRLVNAQRVIWLVQADDYSNFPDIWDQYMISVNEWNNNINQYQSILNHSFNRDLGSKLLTDTDDLNNDIPISIHYKFYRMHESMLNVRNCFYSGCDKTIHLEKLKDILSDFINEKFRFIESLNTSLIDRAKNI